MSDWEREKPCLTPDMGCLTCGAGEMRKDRLGITATMGTRIYGGFGGWHIVRDDETIYNPPDNAEWGEYPTLLIFENMARKDPDHDWRAKLTSPLRDAEYQRQGENRWVLISSGPGFA